jgi:transcriptional regulator with XRE-family HTH domain
MKDPVKYQKALGQAIMERRERLGFSQEKLARLLGVDIDYVAFVEDGKNDLELSEMMCIAGVLSIPLSTLLALAESVVTED